MDNFLEIINDNKNKNEILDLLEKISKYIDQNIVINYIVDNHNNLHNKNIKKLTPFTMHFYKLNNNYVNNTLSTILGLIYNKYDFNYESELFGSINPTIITNAINELNSKGYYKFDFLLDDNTCESIIKKAQKLRFISKKDKKEITGINIKNVKSSTNWVKEQAHVANISEVQNILTDPYILSIAQEYMNTIPINSQTNLWFSVANKLGDTTQEFHQDFGDVKFLKIFIYLNDVDQNNGPHTYIENSINNKHLPPNYKPSQRLTKNWVDKYYKNDVKQLTGKKGSILFVDTFGFHKGGTLLKGHRILLQLEFTCSTTFMEQKKLSKCALNMDNNIKNKMMQHNKCYVKYL